MGGYARKRLGLGAALALVIAILASITGGPAGAVLPGVIDISVSIGSRPATVSPPGELVLYRVAVSNVGVVATSSDVVVDLPAGTAYRDDLSGANCEASGDDVACTVPSLSATQKYAFDVVAHTPVVAGTYTATAVVTARDVVEPLEYQANNTSSANTKVQAPNGQIAAGLVEGGDSLSLDVGDGRKYEVTVPANVPGVIVERLAAQSGAGKICGSAGLCGDGFILKFVEGHPTFHALDPMNPLVAELTYGSQDPCRGLSGTCADMYWAPDDSTTLLAKMPNCPGSDAATAGDGTARPAPCINRRYKVSGTIYFDMRLLSTDPLTVPPLLLK
jgi:hypothetical protein